MVVVVAFYENGDVAATRSATLAVAAAGVGGGGGGGGGGGTLQHTAIGNPVIVGGTLDDRSDMSG